MVRFELTISKILGMLANLKARSGRFNEIVIHGLHCSQSDVIRSERKVIKLTEAMS